MSENKKLAEGKTKEKPAEQSQFKRFCISLGTGIMVVLLNAYPPFNEDMFAAFMLLLVIIIFNFGISYMSAFLIAIFTPSFVFAVYGWAAGRAFVLFNFLVAFYLIIRGVFGIIKALGTGIGEKMESAKPTPPSWKIWEEATFEIGSKTGEMVGKSGYVTAGGAKGIVRKSGSAFENLIKKFRELMQH